MDSPNALLGSLPARNSFPVETVEVVEHPGGVHNEVVLSVVDHNSSSFFEEGNDIACVAAGDVCGEGVIDVIVSRGVVDVIGDSEAFATIVEKGDEGVIPFSVLPEVEGAHPSQVLVPGIIVVGEEVKELSGLNRKTSTFLLSPNFMWWIAWVWNQVQVSLNWLETMPTLYR